jgi:hypothetical protein
MSLIITLSIKRDPRKLGDRAAIRASGWVISLNSGAVPAAGSGRGRVLGQRCLTGVRRS